MYYLCIVFDYGDTAAKADRDRAIYQDGEQPEILALIKTRIM